MIIWEEFQQKDQRAIKFMIMFKPLHTIVVGALRRILKGMVKGLEDLEIRGQLETI